MVRFFKQLIKRLLMLRQVLMHRDDSPKIVFYHDVGKRYTRMGADSAIFWSHMKHVVHYSCHEVAFDDGYCGIWDERERFKVMGIRPTVFIAIRLVGQPGYLTWDEIRTLQNEYGFRFECHTWSHQTLAGPMIDESPKADRTEAWFHRELVDSKAELERQLGREVESLCFPVGYYSEDLLRRCAAAGYKKVYSSIPGNITDDCLQYRNLVQDFSPFDFKLALRGGMMAFRNRYSKMHRFEK